MTLSVSQLNEYVRRVVQMDPVLHGLTIKGEISNLKLHQTGTIFFTLKDENAAIGCVMYAQAAQTLSAMPFEGMKATVTGNVGYYTRGGQIQFYAESLQTQGVGVLYERLLALKGKLSAEGIFREERKRAIPEYIDTIGVVSSPTGAVIHDILNVSLRRDPQSRILLCPVRVQGIGAADEVARAIELLDRLPNVNVIIVARGGGSIEDLWTFNEEMVVRAVAACSTPIVSAVGHETDVTLCDLAADLRAPTPSAAAECVVALRQERLDALEQARKQLGMLARQRIAQEESRIDALRAQMSALHPRRMLAAETERVAALKAQLQRAAQTRLEKEEDRLARVRKELELLSPYHVLERGYAIVKCGDRVIASAAQAQSGDRLCIQMHDGMIQADVLDAGK